MGRLVSYLFLAAGIFLFGITLSCGGMQNIAGQKQATDKERIESTRDDGSKGGKAVAEESEAREPMSSKVTDSKVPASEGRIASKRKGGDKDEPALPGSTGKRNGKNRGEDSFAAADTGGKGHASDGTVSDERPSGSTARPEGPSGLKAGFADDNRQYNYFIDFLKKFSSSARHFPIDVSERIILKVVDSNKKPVLNAKVKIFGGQSLLASGLTCSDGSFLFFPSEHGRNIASFSALVEHNQAEKKLDFNRTGRRDVVVALPGPRPVPGRVSLDILFIFDTTGSMGEEIERLRRTIELIYLNLSSIPGRPLVRFGMVLYKDRRDEYVTRVVPLTDNLEAFQAELNHVQASGGGDLPEDLQEALKDSIQRIQWSRDGIRMAFIITDAPPHLDYGQQYTYREAVKDARGMGIKMFTVGSGGLDINGEYVLRQISQYTNAKYIFLTFGEKGEASGGREGSVSHHTGANYQTDKLETIIIRFARDELNNALEGKLPDLDEHFLAKKVDFEKNEETIRRLFGMAASQLADYSAINISSKTPTSVLPIEPADPALKVTAEYFGEQLSFSLIKSGTFKLVERKNLQGILRELELTMAGLSDQGNAAKVGKILGAQLLVTGKLYKKQDKYELFMKLLRVETAEVLSVTKARLDFALGLEGQKEVKGVKKKAGIRQKKAAGRGK